MAIVEETVTGGTVAAGAVVAGTNSSGSLSLLFPLLHCRNHLVYQVLSLNTVRYRLLLLVFGLSLCGGGRIISLFGGSRGYSGRGGSGSGGSGSNNNGGCDSGGSSY